MVRLWVLAEYLSSGECARALRGTFLACKHSKGKHGKWIASYGILGSAVRCRKAWISPLLLVVSADTRLADATKSIGQWQPNTLHMTDSRLTLLPPAAALSRSDFCLHSFVRSLLPYRATRGARVLQCRRDAGE